MPINWTDPQADAKLLVGIIELHNIRIDHKALAEFMGQGCTASAIQHRIQRIKGKVQNGSSVESTATADGGASPGSAPQQEEEGGSVPDATPTRPKRGRPAKRGAKSPAAKKQKVSARNDFT
ncbi:hypothetical protein BDV26DRAFT_256053 [Aspergillus bertholletiae]|uniref:AT hook motif protein n=1 Tax=Aspergillus bertholletiae TaxID=1226010 RepID=A0A5N7BH31_9EURO|nr:hypothetical protein BDV26DRAFT_256053 [Aspergillus bertholletiae]